MVSKDTEKRSSPEIKKVEWSTEQPRIQKKLNLVGPELVSEWIDVLLDESCVEFDGELFKINIRNLHWIEPSPGIGKACTHFGANTPFLRGQGKRYCNTS